MYSLILLAGGDGNRMRQALPKQYLQLAGRPVITHIMERVDNIEAISEVIVVCDETYNALILNYIGNMNLRKPYTLVAKGNTRQQSVYNGLTHASYDHVIVHEAARPFVTVDDFEKLIAADAANCTYAVALPFTVLRSRDGYISGLLDRNELVNIQLPQKFDREILLAAHIKAIEEKKVFTEDASMLLAYGLGQVKILPGKEYNIKLTEPLDFIVGEQIYKLVFDNRR